eukprot:scaffold20988_cov15-Tisochrysis_lutea.AAC.1
MVAAGGLMGLSQAFPSGSVGLYWSARLPYTIITKDKGNGRRRHHEFGTRSLHVASTAQSQ